MLNGRRPIWKHRQLLTTTVRWCIQNWIRLVLFSLSVFAASLSRWLNVHEVHTPVGVYIALMGLVVAVMTLRKDPDKWEKFLWVTLVTVLMVAEIQNLYKVDALQTQTFKNINSDLDTTKKGLEVAAKSIEKATEGLDRVLSEVTGGDTYMYFAIASINGPQEVNVPNYGGKQSVMFASAIPIVKGTYPLHEVQVHISDPLGDRQIPYGTMTPWRFGVLTQAPSLRFRPEKHRQHVFIEINSLNGEYAEFVLFLKVENKWVRSIRYYKGAGNDKKLIHEWPGKDFPKSIGTEEWKKEDD